MEDIDNDRSAKSLEQYKQVWETVKEDTENHIRVSIANEICAIYLSNGDFLMLSKFIEDLGNTDEYIQSEKFRRSLIALKVFEGKLEYARNLIVVSS